MKTDSEKLYMVPKYSLIPKQLFCKCKCAFKLRTFSDTDCPSCKQFRGLDTPAIYKKFQLAERLKNI